jgi:hypothetical protein
MMHTSGQHRIVMRSRSAAAADKKLRRGRSSDEAHRCDAMLVADLTGDQGDHIASATVVFHLIKDLSRLSYREEARSTVT